MDEVKPLISRLRELLPKIEESIKLEKTKQSTKEEQQTTEEPHNETQS